MGLRIAIVGGGTAGFMAATHLSRNLPSAEVMLVLDPRIPTIGVGEGTTPGFAAWLDDLAGLSFAELQRSLRVTRKRGIRFENWGRAHLVYTHEFVPTGSAGLHLSASQLVAFLREYFRGEVIEGHVLGLDGHDSHAVVRLEGSADLVFDLVLDARGFPRELDKSHLRLSWVPTNAAFITRTARVLDLEWTRAVARPHGWIFGIALTEDTAYGYIFGTDTATAEAVMDDFREFLASEGISDYLPPRRIDFPNFVCRKPFERRVLKIGNAASFIEPLEATAIAVTRYELSYLIGWLRALESSSGWRIAAALVDELNRKIVDLVTEVSLFVAWHYAEGSAFDTAFWRGATQRFRRGFHEGVSCDVRERFLEQLAKGLRFSELDVSTLRDREDLERFLSRQEAFPSPFGGMTPLGFAQVARGIGCREARIPMALVS